ncbi:MAG: BLUF domain-containing protein [Anaerolineales bacterium]|nr:BLUF domain-containing protein [Anaerolineales bacterium]
MNSANLTHLIYTSVASPQLDASDLKQILQVARSNNSQSSVTGMLLYISNSFFQILEGDEATLIDLFKIISADPRHVNVTMIIQEPIAERAFGDWTMGFSEVAPSELEEVEGLSDFFQKGDSLTNLQPGRAKKLLSAFAKGRWRARLDGAAK